MPAPMDPHVEQYSRVDEHVKQLDRQGTSPRVLAAVVAGTSEETAHLFASSHTLAADATGPVPEE